MRLSDGRTEEKEPVFWESWPKGFVTGSRQ